jgi:biotin synthase-like enzyme
LAVSLGVKCSRELNLNFKDTAEFVLEIWYKLGTIVRDNWFRDAIELVDIINVKVGHIFCSYGFKTREGDGLLI